LVDVLAPPLDRTWVRRAVERSHRGYATPAGFAKCSDAPQALTIRIAQGHACKFDEGTFKNGGIHDVDNEGRHRLNRERAKRVGGLGSNEKDTKLFCFIAMS